MPLDGQKAQVPTPLYTRTGADVPERVAALNARYRHHGATAVSEHALADADLGQVALVSSFGAESVVLLHLVSVIAPRTPVIFVDTKMLFAETLEYQRHLAETLALCDVRTIRAPKSRLDLQDPDATLHQYNTASCCHIRKVEPLEHALAGFDGWITGRKRYQGTERAAVEFFESEDDLRIKVNPLAHWGRGDIDDYMTNNRLPRHPLVAKGYASIGCAPCTTPIAPGEDPRAGRWRGSAKSECGIHQSTAPLRARAAQPADQPTAHAANQPANQPAVQHAVQPAAPKENAA